MARAAHMLIESGTVYKETICFEARNESDRMGQQLERVPNGSSVEVVRRLAALPRDERSSRGKVAAAASPSKGSATRAPTRPLWL